MCRTEKWSKENLLISWQLIIRPKCVFVFVHKTGVPSGGIHVYFSKCFVFLIHSSYGSVIVSVHD